MASTVEIHVSPTNEPPVRRPGVLIDVAFDTELDNGTDTATVVQQIVRFTLDDLLSGTTRLESVQGSSVRVSVLAQDGAALVARTVVVAGDRADVVLGDDEVGRILAGGQRLPDTVAPLLVRRSVRLVPTGSTRLDYGSSTLAVAAVWSAEHLKSSGLEDLLNTQGGRFVTAIELTSAALPVVGRIAWTPAHVAVDGSFTVGLPMGPSAGWLWWLAGDRSVLGFVADDLAQPRTPLVLTLPAFVAGPIGDRPASTHGGDGVAGGGLTVPADVSEAELADNPDVYSEDPGSFCRPFANPERVVGEKAFLVIARVTQPALGALGSRKLRSLDILQLDGDRLPARPPVTAVPRPGFLRGLRARAAGARPAAVALAALDLLPHRHELLGRYDELLRRLSVGRRRMDADNPLQWEDDIAQYQAAEIALGHVLEFRVRWRSNGYSLGTVAKTLTLAPRQTRRIQKIEWHRSERASRRERTSLADRTDDSVVSERDFSDSVAAHLEEWSSGGSSSDTAAVASGTGFAAPGVVGGVGAAAASANSTSHQEGGRDATASETQRLRDAIRRHGDALRRFESTVVTEVTQEETVTGTTEVIRNANYAHSLTVIHYQILRHLRVTTEFAGVQQCVFVPFALRPFDVQRAYRWRESIAATIRSPRFGRALRYLKDVATEFATSDIDAGPRATQPLTYVRGSVYVALGIERPRDTTDGTFEQTAWEVAQPLLGTPALGIHSALAAASASLRDAIFQREHAPDMAANWADRLTFALPNRVLRADTTLASRYRFNKPVRIDFTIPAEELAGLRRQDLRQLRVTPELDLPPGSVANLTRLSLVYSTLRYEHAVEARAGTNDLVKPITGLADQATVSLPLDRWEQVDERLELIRAVQELVEHLNEHVEYYHKAIWWRMDRDRLLMMLDGFYVPFTADVSVASIVEREPLAIIGNSLVYRVGAASFVPIGKVTTPEELRQVYAGRAPTADPLHISLPTDGLYAQTIMDECGALEEHYGNTDWALNDPDPELGALDAQLLGSRESETPGTAPTPFPATIINLQNAPTAPAPEGLAGVLDAVTSANAFRDMTGLAGTQANARAALESAAGLATSFGGQAAALELAKLAKAEQATRDVDRKVASIKNAKDKGLTSDTEAAQQTKAALAAMNPDAAPSDAPHTNPALNAAIDAASAVPGSTIEATNSEGMAKVTIGKQDATRPVIDDVRMSGHARAFGPPIDLIGVTTLAVRGRNLPSGSTLRWSIPATATGHYTITQAMAAGTAEVTISGIRPGRTDIDVEALDAAGVIMASLKVPLSIPQFVTVDDDNADLDAFLTTNNLIGIREPILAECRSTVDLLVGPIMNVRLVWKSAGTAVPVHIPAGFVTTAKLADQDPTGNQQYAETKGSSAVGASVFDEVIEVYPASYLVAGPGKDLNVAVNSVVRELAALQTSDPDYVVWLIRLFGRLIGETLAHEIHHALLPDAFDHNVDIAKNYNDTGDIMDSGANRSLTERTGIRLDRGTDADLLDNLDDVGPASINQLTDPVNLAFVQATYPVPPVKPFDT